MKIFNVKLVVNINEVGALPDLPPEPEPAPEKFDDDPISRAGKLMDKYLTQINAPRSTPFFPGAMYPGESNGVSLSLNFSIIAADFEEVQRILAKFHSTATEIHESRPAPTPVPPQAFAVGGMG